MEMRSIIPGIVISSVGMAGLAAMMVQPSLSLGSDLDSYLAPAGAFGLFVVVAIAGVGMTVRGLVNFGARSISVLDLQSISPAGTSLTMARPMAGTKASSGPRARLSELELAIMWNISEGKTSVRRLSMVTGVDPAVISRRIQGLRQIGYVTEDNHLSERGSSGLESMESSRLWPQVY